MKKTLIILMIAALLTACGGAGNTQTGGGSGSTQSGGETQSPQPEGAGEEAQNSGDKEQEEGGEAVSNIPLSDIYSKITDAVELNAPVNMPESFLENTYGINLKMLEDYLVVISEAATSAETIAILKVKDPADIETAKEALSVIVNEKSMEMENYLPDQYELVKKGILNTKGNYAYLVISENADKIIGVIEENIG